MVFESSSDGSVSIREILADNGAASLCLEAGTVLTTLVDKDIIPDPSNPNPSGNSNSSILIS